jgi:hypothetical protein
MWSPRSATDKRKHVEMAELLMPVFFEGKDGGLGLSLRTCIHGRCRVLRDPTVPAPLGQKTTTHIRIVVSMAFGWFAITSNSFTVNISGLVIKSSSGKSHFVTIRVHAITSPWLSSLIRLGGLWIPFFRSVVRHHHCIKKPPCAELYFLVLRIGLYEYRRATRTVADRARWHPAVRHCDHRCRSSFCGKLDADHATESLHFLTRNVFY